MTSFDDLADDMVINILSRLSAKQILQTRIVCKLWNRLTTLPGFARFHVEKSDPVDLFLQHQVTIRDPNDVETLHRLSSVDWKEGESGGETKIRSTSLKAKYICGACDGLFIGKELVFHYPKNHYYIFNPVTREQRLVPGVGSDFVLGLYFHPPTRKYKLLCLSSEEKWINNRFYTRNVTSKTPQTEVGTFAHHVPKFAVTESLTIEDRIYSLLCCTIGAPCCERFICVFHMHTEKLEFMPYPVKCRSHDDRLALRCGTHRLINMAGKLGMTHHQPFHVDIERAMLGRKATIWVLEDPAKGLWVKKFRLKPHLIMYRGKQIPSDIVRVMIFKDGEFLVGCSESLSFYRAGSRKVSTLEERDISPKFWRFIATFHCKLGFLSPREI